MMKIAILGNYATQFLQKSLKKACKNLDKSIEWYEADFNAIQFEVIDEQSGLYTFSPDYIIWHESYLGLRDSFYEMSSNDQQTFAEAQIDRIKNLCSIINERLPHVKILFPLPVLINDNVFGNYFSKIKGSWGYQSLQLNWQLTALSHQTDSFYIIDGQPIGLLPTTDWSQVVNAELHFTLDYLGWLSKSIAGCIASFKGQFKKCLILDLDNTLWGGIIGDDGLEGIQLGALGNGKAFSRLQKWIKQLKKRGIILAICSKNNEEIAKQPFMHHPDMHLSLDDIAVFIANWNSKADNIQHIQQILNIGYDSMVFLDDNPAEREIVRQHIPEIMVPELPEDPAEYLPFIIGLNIFETTTYSKNDETRTQQYQEESKRVQLASSITNMDDYLASLAMESEIGTFQSVDYDRIAQLTQRSNQFNLRTIRYTPIDIKNISEDNSYVTVSVKLSDKFGKYGLISLLIIKIDENNEAFIDTWVMSCRVLKRTVEPFVLNYVVERLKEAGVILLHGEYLPTAKNALVSNLLPDMGFSSTAVTNKYVLNLRNFNQLNTKIIAK